MKSVARMELIPGMELGEDIIDRNGKILYHAGHQLQQKDIDRLAVSKILVVTIKEDEDLVDTHYEKVLVSSGFRAFSQAYAETLPQFINILDRFAIDPTDFQVRDLFACYIKLTSCVKDGKTLLDYLYHLVPAEETLIYSHMLNSGLIAGVFATWLGLSKEDAFLLVQCACLYDIGKLKLPREIIFKPGKLTDLEYATIKTHTMLGFTLLQDAGLDPHIAKTALMHHERCDGTGYPSKLRDQQIDPFAKYIAIIDSYAAMSSPRSYRQSLNPFEVIDNFERDGFLHYDITALNHILFHIASSQTGLGIRLSDGTEGTIVLINSEKLSRPYIRYESGEMLDLSLRPDLKIVSIF